MLGEGCNLGQNVFVADGVTLGRNVKVQNNVSLYAGVECADDVFLGPSVVFTNVRNPRAAVPRRGDGHYLPTRLGRGVSIGANSTIVCGVTLGEYAFVGAGSVVTRDVLPYSLVYGNPARPHGWMSAHGHQLAFDDGRPCHLPRKPRRVPANRRLRFPYQPRSVGKLLAGQLSVEYSPLAFPDLKSSSS